MEPIEYTACVSGTQINNYRLHGFKMSMDVFEKEKVKVTSPYMGAQTGEAFVCKNFQIPQNGLRYGIIYYGDEDEETENQKVTGVKFLWAVNTDQDDVDNLDTLIGVESDLFEGVNFSDSDVFFGFYGTENDEEIESLGFLVHDPVCS